MPKFQIELDDATYEALAALALEELRQVPQQAAWVLMQTLRARMQDARMTPSLARYAAGAPPPGEPPLFPPTSLSLSTLEAPPS